MDFEQQLKERVAEAEKIITAFLPAEEGYQKTVLEAMNYSVRSGGKRLRPVMLSSAYRMCGGKGENAHAFMAALEMIHCYSLVHDDLPEMDNDDLRRGLPTTHKKYGQAQAVLAGDGLLNYAYETMLKAAASFDGSELKRAVVAADFIAKMAGVFGMVGGQCLDVEAEEKGLSLKLNELLFVYENKTAALLQAALKGGAILAGADESVIKNLGNAAHDLGIAFQLQDDILDIEGNEEELGKPIGSDERNGKVTYVSYLGMEEAKKEQKRLSESAAELIRGIKAEDKEEQEFLAGLVEYLVMRRS